MLAYVPPVEITWLTITWAACWSVWATVDSMLKPRHVTPVVVAHCINLLFSLQWWTFLTLQLTGVWSRAQYVEFVAPYAPVVFLVGPWSVWSIKHIASRRSLRRNAVDHFTLTKE